MPPSSPSPNVIYWDWVNGPSLASPNALQLLMRVRRGDDLTLMSADYPGLTTMQLDLARDLQAQEAELNRLYQDIQRIESRKLQLERELTHSLQAQRAS
ncbi:MAG: hypothetical protein AAFX65_09325 [Cyanobacteria bacterium J06638_7]